jgi:uncharacterized membrane protein
MTRSEFLAVLRAGLAGLPGPRIRELVADYDAHFAEGLADGRSEEEIAAALGDPARLARELRAEEGFLRWEAQKTPGNMAGAVLALAGLATVDVMFILPFLFTLGCIFLGFFGASFGMFVGGMVLSMFSLFPGMAWAGLMGDIGGPLALALLGVGLIAGGIGLGCLTWVVADWVVRALVRYARLHFQLIDAVTV